MAILVDTSVWVRYFRASDPLLRDLLENDYVASHPLVIGELACGNLKQRKATLESLQCLPQTSIIEFSEVLSFIERHHLYGRGLGWIDLHLLASTLLDRSKLWTLDGPLRHAARTLHCAFDDDV